MTVRPPRAARESVSGRKPGPKRSGPRSGVGLNGAPRTEIRHEVLEAALAEFAQVGFEAATVRRIAERAGVNHGMVTYYYRSKEQLWRAALERLFKRLEKEVLHPVQAMPKNPRELRSAAREGLKRYVRYCARHPEHARIMMQESVRASSRLTWVIDTYLRRNYAAAAEVVAQLQAHGLAPKIEPMTLISIVIGGAQLIYALEPEVRETWGVDPTTSVAVEAHAEAMASLLFGPEPSPG